jgi:hypothetical protein
VCQQGRLNNHLTKPAICSVCGGTYIGATEWNFRETQVFLFNILFTDARTSDGNIPLRRFAAIQKYVRNMEMSLRNIQNKLLQHQKKKCSWTMLRAMLRATSKHQRASSLLPLVATML